MDGIYLINHDTLKDMADNVRLHTRSINHFNPEILADNRFLVDSAVSIYYIEYIDNGVEEGGDYFGRTEGNLQSYNIVAYDYLPNNMGIVTPVLLKYWDTDAPEEQYVDIYEPFYYVGTSTVNEQVYDKWQKIEINSETGEIVEGGYNWTDAKQYIYTNTVIITEADDTPLTISNFMQSINNKVNEEEELILTLIHLIQNKQENE